MGTPWETDFTRVFAQSGAPYGEENAWFVVYDAERQQHGSLSCICKLEPALGGVSFKQRFDAFQGVRICKVQRVEARHRKVEGNRRVRSFEGESAHFGGHLRSRGQNEPP